MGGLWGVGNDLRMGGRFGGGGRVGEILGYEWVGEKMEVEITGERFGSGKEMAASKGRRWWLGERGAKMGFIGRGCGCLNAFLCISSPPQEELSRLQAEVAEVRGGGGGGRDCFVGFVGAEGVIEVSLVVSFPCS